MFSKLTFRASEIGNIMGGVPKPLTDKQNETYADLLVKFKSGTITQKQTEIFGDLSKRKRATSKLNDSAKKWLETKYFELVTGRSSKLVNKYLDKGIQSEEASITLYSEYKNILFLKNKDRLDNGWFQGECDNAQGIIRDIKTSWDYTTFPMTETSIKTSGYKWQLDVYMELWNMDDSELIYCLVDTPSNLIEDELRRMDWKFNIMDQSGEIRDDKIDLVVESIINKIFTEEGLKEFCDQSSTIHLEWFDGIFKEIPQELRLKVFNHARSEKRVQQMRSMVELAREYLNKLDKLNK